MRIGQRLVARPLTSARHSIGEAIMLRYALTASFALALLSFSLAQIVAAEEEHAHKGPHKGDLVELGEEEYHAEIVHDDKEGVITVYLLGSDAKTAVATNAKDIAVNAKVKGKGVQIKINPAPQKSDTKGTSSRFVSKSKELMELIEDHDAKPMLRVVIEGKTYNGKIEHEHDEEHEEKPAPKKK